MRTYFLFDQDSRPPDKFMQEMLNFKARHSKNNPEAAFMSPISSTETATPLPSFPVFHDLPYFFLGVKKHIR